MNALTVWNLIVTKQRTSPNRLWKDAGLALLILTALVFIGHFGEPTTSHSAYVAFGIAMFVVALNELGGHTFSEYKNERFAFQWLTLPASMTEKWLANFVYSFLIVPIAFLFILTLSTILANILTMIFGTGSPMPIFNPFTLEGWINLKVYWQVHPVLFFGAVYFRKRVILKTFGSIALVAITLMIFTAWFGHLLFADVLSELQHMAEGSADEEQFFLLMQDSFQLNEDGFILQRLELLKGLGNVLFYGYFLFFWGLSYLRFTEWEL